MKKLLLIRIPAPFSPIDANTVVQWGKYTSGGALLGELHLTPVNQLKEAWCADEPEDQEEVDRLPDEAIFLVGGSLCLYKHLTINAGQKKHLATALPYLVEEHLAQDIETMHIINGFPDKDLQVSVAGIPHSTLQAMLALFDQNQLPLTSIVAEMQLLKPEPGYTCLMLDNDSVMMAAPGREGITLNDEAIPFIFPDHSGQEDPDTLASSLENSVSETVNESPSQVRIMFSDNTLAVATARIDEISGLLSERGWLIDKVPLKASVFEYFAEHYFTNRRCNQLLDFRQGAYQCPGRTGRFIRRWWPLVAAAGCWLVIELGLSVTAGMIYQNKSELLWRESIKNYLAVFPNDRQAQQALVRQQMSFNVKQVMDHRLRTLDTQTSKTPFLSMLQALSRVSGSMGEKGKLKSRNLDFNDATGQLIYEFETDELDTVNRFLEKLNATDLQGKLDNANQGKSGVIARVSIKR
ncbi:type II secretion system protein GspL [Endozoicomonas sp. SCSIO W0465]|uniref:type II secretion system protein GspL n=1 Tax=Endozoicomonas sp. SCSIO W0465 TaxID=2918516 RepID=UPI0020751BAD|nr:type II secretion system protein GspL [Endozoicomonas sp. SCSIO W0465]USE38809.1 type II secretion system protein GspL [Endozoicomonas sp. SCSIO W0465]